MSLRPARKATVVAPANIAFVKYWGAHDLEEVRPVNRSISMTLREAVTRTTVDPHAADVETDELEIVGDDGQLRRAQGLFESRALAHVRRVRDEIGYEAPVRIATHNSFPTGAGIASSASGFTALTLAIRAACGAPEGGADVLSRQVRRSGSGSAARSVLGGYVEWPSDSEDSDPAAAAFAPASHWDLIDLIAIVTSETKSVTSRDGHRRAATSPHFARRLELLDRRLGIVQKAIVDRDLAALGPVLEEEAIELHLVAMSSQPPIFYWEPATLAVLSAVRQLRDEGVPVWATMDAGPNVHMICEPEAETAVAERVGALAGVVRLLHDRVGMGPMEVEDHLF